MILYGIPESWLSGRKRVTANDVGESNPLEGSNPSDSADMNIHFRFTACTVR